MIRIHQILLLAAIGFFYTASYAQLPIVKVKQMTNACGTTKGSIELELIGDTSNIHYKWENGLHSLKRVNLDPGNYKFSLTGQQGLCDSIVIQKEIKSLVSPSVSLTNIPKPHCSADININISQSGVALDLNAFGITWNDSIKNTFQRNVAYKNVSSQLCAVVNDLGKCGFSNTICTNLPSNTCGNTINYFPKIIVNEYNCIDSAKRFVELFVIGDGICTNTTDLRYYFLHSYLKPQHILDSAEFVNKILIQFSGDDKWAKVPNGSIILITSVQNKFSQ